MSPLGFSCRSGRTPLAGGECRQAHCAEQTRGLGRVLGFLPGMGQPWPREQWQQRSSSRRFLAGFLPDSQLAGRWAKRRKGEFQINLRLRIWGQREPLSLTIPGISCPFPPYHLCRCVRVRPSLGRAQTPPLVLAPQGSHRREPTQLTQLQLELSLEEKCSAFHLGAETFAFFVSFRPS